jgi:hypothetical protein
MKDKDVGKNGRRERRSGKERNLVDRRYVKCDGRDNEKEIRGADIEGKSRRSTMEGLKEVR